MEKEELKFKPGDKIYGKSTKGTDITILFTKGYVTIKEILDIVDNKIRFTVEEIPGYWECNLKDIHHYKDYQNVMDIEVGDTVKCISKDESKFGRYAGAGWYANSEFKVTKVTDHVTYKVYFGGKNNRGVYSDAVRLVKRKEPERTVPEGYKVIGKVRAPSSNISHINGQDWIIVEEINKPKLEWKIGAYVRYKGTKFYDNHWNDYFDIYNVKAGDVGIIVQIFKDTFFIQDVKRKSVTRGCLLKEDLELITKEEYDAGVAEMQKSMLFSPDQEEIIVEELAKHRPLVFESPKLKFKGSVKEFKINKVNISNKQLKKEKNEQIKFIR